MHGSLYGPEANPRMLTWVTLQSRLFNLEKHFCLLFACLRLQYIFIWEMTSKQILCLVLVALGREL